jgi:hypothetical protein
LTAAAYYLITTLCTLVTLPLVDIFLQNTFFTATELAHDNIIPKDGVREIIIVGDVALKWEGLKPK